MYDLEIAVADDLIEAIGKIRKTARYSLTRSEQSAFWNEHPRLKALIAEMQAVQNALDFGTAERSDRKLKVVA